MLTLKDAYIRHKPEDKILFELMLALPGGGFINAAAAQKIRFMCSVSWAQVEKRRQSLVAPGQATITGQSCAEGLVQEKPHCGDARQ